MTTKPVACPFCRADAKSIERIGNVWNCTVCAKSIA
jgi:ribosomal protein L37AE/L43A